MLGRSAQRITEWPPMVAGQKIEKRVFVLSWVVLLFGIVMSSIGLLSLVQSIAMGKIL